MKYIFSLILLLLSLAPASAQSIIGQFTCPTNQFVSGFGILDQPTCGSPLGTGVTSVIIAAGTGISTSGTCTITSTGTCTLSLAAIAADTLLLNATGGSAAPTAQAIGNCANALTYSTSTHLFGCNSGLGNGTVTSISTGCGSSASSTPITTMGTIFATVPINAQTGTSYTVADGDCGKLTTLSNGSAVAITLPQAGSGGLFVAGWFADYHNKGAGTVTITPTTSTIDGAATLVLLTGHGVTIVSDGTNYQIREVPPVLGPASVTSGHVATFNGTSGKLLQDGGALPTGTVSSITCNGGLTGGAITTSGTCAVDIATNSNCWSGTASKILDTSVNDTCQAPITVTVSSHTFTPDFNTLINFTITLETASCSCTIANPTNQRAGRGGFMKVIQPASGGPGTITAWGTTWKLPGGTLPILSATNGQYDIIPFFCSAVNECTIGTPTLNPHNP